MSYIDGFLIGADEYDLVDTSTIDNICTTVEDGSTASKTLNAGEYILRDGQLYKVLTTIAAGAAFVVNTNIEAVTVGEEMSEINNNLSGLLLNTTKAASNKTLSANAMGEYDVSITVPTGYHIVSESVRQYGSNINSWLLPTYVREEGKLYVRNLSQYAVSSFSFAVDYLLASNDVSIIGE